MDPRTSAQDVMRCDLCETAVVQMHCDTCLVNLCKACVGEHILTDESKDHKVVKFQARKSTPIYPGCTFHYKEQCEMFCKQCDIPVCLSCLASEQHLGHELSKVLQVVGEKKDMITKERNELNDTIYPTYQDIASDVQNRISQLEKEYGDLTTAITKHGEDGHREIDKLKSSRQSHSIFTKIHSGKIKSEELSKLFGALSSSSLTSDKHGYSIKTTQKSPEAGSSSPVKQLLDEPETVNTIDTRHRNLWNVVCLIDEEIWTSGTDNTMNLFSISQGSLLKSIKTKSGNEPSYIAVTKSGDLVYTDYLHITENRNQDICVSDDGAKAVVVVNQAGKLRFKYTGHTPAQQIQPFSPRGISTDSQGHILTADYDNHCVHIIDQHGQFLRYIHCGLNHPRGLCTDTFDNLFVAQLFNKQVRKIKYLK
ncbi:E3 ubiquitin-protein ligase TRIM71-like [Saccostrea cucullata]|uniref:E3 ubiquitin-protein ligase TRIM71-like n=1 Tax=Saccostrea cuccullata TaxID=36930 RepID=UPI002ED6BFB9